MISTLFQLGGLPGSGGAGGVDGAGLLTRLAVDLLCTLILIRGIYYRAYRKADLFLTYFSFNLVIFLITYLLNRVEISLGAAFGLFAVFSMLRYRTEGISTKDMTYLFLVIAMGLLMAVSPAAWWELLFLGALILVSVQVLEGNWLARRELRQRVLYDNVELVTTEAREALIADLRRRTGLQVHRVEIREIDYIRDSARLTVYYYP